MAKRRPGAGRKRKPRELHILQGTWREDRHGKKPEQPSQADEARPPCPPHLAELSADHGRYWEMLCDHMARSGLSFHSALVPMELWVIVYANLRKALDFQSKLHPIFMRHRVVREGDGHCEKVVEVKRNPLTVEIRALTEQLVRISAEIGLTPTARERLLSTTTDKMTIESRVATRKRA